MFAWLREQFLPVDRAQKVGRLLLLCAVVGIAAGAGAILFELLTEWLKHLLMDGIAGYRPPDPAGAAHLFHPTETPYKAYLLACLPPLGGLAGGLLVWRFAPEAEGHGTDAAIDAYHHRQGNIRTRVPLIKMLASAITLGTAGSAGREGPIAQIGAGFGVIMSRILKLSVRERRLLMVAGMAAGIGAVFRAPLAAALLAAEVLYREMDMEFEVIVPATISSIVAYSVFTLAFGNEPLFSTPHFIFENPAELLPYSVLALVVAAGAKIYVLMFYGTRDWFARLDIPPFVKPALGGAAVGVFALFLPEALGSGYGLIQNALYGGVPFYLLAAVALAKMVTTSFTIGSGGSGGVFGPSMVIGGALGASVGHVFQLYTPGISAPEGAFVVVGMAGFFSAAAHTPISTIIMVSEITGNYELLVPSMWVCIIAFLLVRRSTLYENQLNNRADSPVHLGEMMGDVLRRLTVEEALENEEHESRVVTVLPTCSIHELLDRYAETQHTSFAVVTEEGELLGIIDDRVLRQAVHAEDGLAPLLIAADIMEKAPVVFLDETLDTAVHKMVMSRHDELAVVARNEPTRVVGTVSRRDLIAAYDAQVHQSRR